MKKRKIVFLIICVLFLMWFFNPKTIPSNKFLVFMDKYNEPNTLEYEKRFYTEGVFSQGLIPIALYDEFHSENYGYMNKHGDVIIPHSYEYAKGFNEGLAAVKKENKYGYINKENELIIPFRYDNANDFNCGRAIVKIGENKGVIDKDGKEIIPFIYNSISDYYVETEKEYIYLCLNGEKKEFIDKNGKLIFSADYDSLEVSEKGGYVIVEKAGKWGIVDISGNLCFSLDYDYIQIMEDKTVILEKDGLHAIYSLDGKELVPYSETIYEYMQVGLVRKGNLRNPKTLSVCDIYGKQLTKEGKYILNRGYFGNGYITPVGNLDKMGLIDREGNFVARCKYDSLLDGGDGYYFFQRNGKTGLLKDGKELFFIDYKFSRLYPIDEKYICIENNVEGNLYIISKEGKFINKIKAEWISKDKDMYCVGFSDKKRAYLTEERIIDSN